MNFVHTADLHLGYRQYDLDQRLKDFAGAFLEIARYAVAAQAEFVLIAGDLFHARNINAPTFMQAYQVLSTLEEAGIPCIAIAGNHDRPFVKDHLSWLEALEQYGLIRLVKPGRERLMDGHVDIGQTRIFGLGYSGASTTAIIPRVAQEIREINAARQPEHTVLMMHTGVEGQAKGGIIGETRYEDLCQLKDTVDYLALGHYHNAYELDGWAYNPGSPETCSLAEVSEPKGFFHYVNGDVSLKQVKRRPFIVIPVKVDDHLSATSLMGGLEQQLSSVPAPETRPVVAVLFRGCLSFDRSHVDLERVQRMVVEKLDPVYVEARFDLSNDPFCLSGIDSEGFDRLAVEREVLSKLAMSDSMLADYSHFFAAALSELKDLAVKEADAGTLDALLRRTFEGIRDRTAPRLETGIIIEKAAERTPTLALEEKPPAQGAKRREKKPKATPEKVEAAAPKVQRRTLDEYWGGKA